MEKEKTNHLKNTSKIAIDFSSNKNNNQGGFSPVILGVIVLLCVVGSALYFLPFKKNTPVQSTGQKSSSPTVVSTTPLPKTESSTAFQNILKNDCLNKSSNTSMSGKIEIDKLPLTIKLNDLKTNKGSCDNDFARYVEIPLNDENSYLTVSDIHSSYCCHGPSSIKPVGKQIKTNGDISIYIHTGTWYAGPNSGYKPIVARGIKNIKLSSGEEIRVLLDRTALYETNTDLQIIEDKYQIIDPYFDSGKKVFTPETVDKLLNDNFFSNIVESSVVKNIEADLENITLK